jgi:hypothetical protein
LAARVKTSRNIEADQNERQKLRFSIPVLLVAIMYTSLSLRQTRNHTLIVTREIELPKESFTLQERADIKIVGAAIKLGEKEMAFFSLYNPPENIINDKLLDFIAKENDYIVMGDLNARMIIHGVPNKVGKALESSLGKMDAKIINDPTKPTFYRHIYGTLASTSTLDLIITNESTSVNCEKVDVIERSAALDMNSDKRPSYFHLPISTRLKVTSRPKKLRMSFNASYLYENVDWDKWQNELEQLLKDDDVNDKTIEDLNKEIIEALVKSSNAHIPKSKEKLERNFNFPLEIVQLLETRNFWSKIFRSTRTDFSAKKYRELQARCSESIAQFKLNNWEEFLRRQGKSPLSSAPFWKRINRLRANKRRNVIRSLTIGGASISDPEKLANIFANDLETKFRTDDNPRYDEVHKGNIESFLSSQAFDNSFSRADKIVPFFTLNELNKNLQMMNQKTSVDPLGLSNKIIKMLKISLVAKNCVLALFNKCLSESKVPKCWKHSEISMLLKSGQSSLLPSSYRPISSTPCIARLFERMVLGRLQDHLNKHNLIVTNQSGFRKARQTRDNLLYLIQTSQQGFNEEKKTLSIFFVIAGAFDKVWHQGLIYKLFMIKVPFYLIKIIIDFLDERTFIVKIEGKKSSVRFIICGAPQGGVLIPTLFSIYINDVPTPNGADEKTLLFADDIVYCLSYKYKINKKIIDSASNEAALKAQVFLNALESWMNRWRLSLAPHKCAQTTFSKAIRNTNDELQITIYGQKIGYDINPKFLGITFDPRLGFENHFDKIKAKVKERINVLKVLSYDKSWSLNTKFLLNIYKVLIRSVMDYANVTTAACNDKIVKELEVLQNDALRVIFKKSILEHVPVSTLLDWAEIETVKERHENLLNSYYEKCLVSNNLLINELFQKYKIFKRRKIFSEEMSVGEGVWLILTGLHSYVKSITTLYIVKYIKQLCAKLSL